MNQAPFWLWYRWPEPETTKTIPLEAGLLFAFASYRLGVRLRGREWLRQRYPQETDRYEPILEIHSELSDVDSPTVREVEYRSVVPTSTEMMHIFCVMEHPRWWFSQPVDGFLALRVMSAGLTAIRETGRILGIGTPKSGRGQGLKTLPFDSPFETAARESMPVSSALAAVIGEQAANQLLLVARGDVSGSIASKQDAIAEILGARLRTKPVADEDEVVRAWTGPLPM